MIRFALKCGQGHGFESWFKSNDAFAQLQAEGQLECPICADTQVDKAVMAPRLANSPAHDTDVPFDGVSDRTQATVEAMHRLRRMVEENTEDVGRRFATEARAIHEGTAPERAIRGEAPVSEARALLQEGIPIVPLPFPPARKLN